MIQDAILIGFAAGLILGWNLAVWGGWRPRH